MKWEDAEPGTRVEYLPAGTHKPAEHGEVIRRSAPGGGLVFVLFDGDQRAKACYASMLEPETVGCDCTELCPMGPTCPGGYFAGLAPGCWRARD